MRSRRDSVRVGDVIHRGEEEGDYMVVLAPYLDQIDAEEGWDERVSALQLFCDLLELGKPDLNEAICTRDVFHRFVDHFTVCVDEEEAKTMEVISLALHSEPKLHEEAGLRFLFESIPSDDDLKSKECKRELLYHIMYGMYSMFNDTFIHLFREHGILERIIYFGGLSEATNAMILSLAVESAKHNYSKEFSLACIIEDNHIVTDSSCDYVLLIVSYLARADSSVFIQSLTQNKTVLDIVIYFVENFPHTYDQVINICCYISEFSISLMDVEVVKADVCFAVINPGSEETLVMALKALYRLVQLSKPRAETYLSTLGVMECLIAHVLNGSYKVSQAGASVLGLVMQFWPEKLDPFSSQFVEIVEKSIEIEDEEAGCAIISGLTRYVEYCRAYDTHCSLLSAIEPCIELISSIAEDCDNDNVCDAADEFLETVNNCFM